jgi:uncharacterized protein DUF6152
VALIERRSDIMRPGPIPPAIALAALFILGAAGPAAGHHSFAVFDHTRSITINGSVTRFQWTNPHGFLELDYSDAGNTKHYIIELPSINMLTRNGWRSSMFKAGDKVKAIVAPLLNGEPGGLLLEVTMPDGRTLEPGVPNPTSYKRTPEPESR